MFKNGATLETMGRVRAIAFDKTGTLTMGQPRVVKIFPVEESEKVLQIAAALENLSEHPIAQAIVYAGQQQHLKWSDAIDVQAKPGQGVTGQINSQRVTVGKAAFVLDRIFDVSPKLNDLSNSLEKDGKTVAWVAQAGKILGIIAVADTVRLQ